MLVIGGSYYCLKTTKIHENAEWRSRWRSWRTRWRTRRKTQISLTTRVCGTLYLTLSPFLRIVDEEDIFDADFESTDDEAQDEEAAGETAAQEEEKRARKARVPSPPLWTRLTW